MDPLSLSRVQFGVVASIHFVFVALTMGLILLIAILETLSVHRDDPVYERAARFWGKLFLINFVLGVVTGLTLEFQFGMNWAKFSRIAGDVVGLPLAIEALAAFFLESVFLAVWWFGRDKISDATRVFSIWMATIGSYLSAFWVLAANSWMHQPVGYLVQSGRIRLTSFTELFLNPHLWRQFPHTVLATAVTGAFFVMGVSAWHLLRDQDEEGESPPSQDDEEIFQRSLRLALVVALISSVSVALVGHEQAQYKAQTQPMKIAAIEALWESEEPASFSLFALIDEDAGENRWEVEVPYALSILAYNRPSGEVKGIEELEKESDEEYGPDDYTPPVWIVYWSFRVMVGLGVLFILLSSLGAWLWSRGQLTEHPLFLKALVYSIPLPYIANTAGWIVAEVGRQPWIVQGVLKTSEAASEIPVTQTWITLIGFSLLYVLLGALDLVLLGRAAREGPEPVEEVADGP